MWDVELEEVRGITLLPVQANRAQELVAARGLDDKVVHDVPPYIKVYEDGSIERLVGTEIAPPGVDPQTGVSSKDIVFAPEIGVSARLYRPAAAADHRKLPLVVYFHGGAFIISSTADPKYHQMLNMLVKEAQIILVSVDYRRAPEHPLPAAYDDSWAAVQWVASHFSGGSGGDSWLSENVDFDKVLFAGDSAGANIAHHLAIKAGLPNNGLEEGFKISGVVMMHPYFWGEEAIGMEAENPFFKAVVDQWWLFVCPSGLGCDDPWINPDPAGFDSLGCGRMLVCVAGNDVLRERGRRYYECVVKSKWKGKAEFVETPGEDHVFHVMDPNTRNSQELIKRCAQFINH